MTTDETKPFCPNCRKPLPADSPLGLCPECLVKSGFSTGTESGAREFVAPPVADIARLFPQFEILDLLGKGGMGAVYRARQPGLDRFIALKLLLPTTQDDPGFAERFSREARALARLNHPNIVSVHDFGQAGGYYFLVMEFVDGMNLRQLERSGRLPPEQALRIVPQICDALQFAHEEGIVHRDIKPENILIDKKGRVKIADFGIAKITGAGPDKVGLTGGRDILGTPHYMAPEQLEKPGTVDHRADIYSLGVVFYELLTGELPLGRFPLPSSRVRVDVRLDDVVLRTLEKEPERRYQHASDVKTAVQTIGTTPPTIPPAARQPAAAPKGNSIALLVVLALLILLFIATGLLFAAYFHQKELTASARQAAAQSALVASKRIPAVAMPASIQPASHLRYQWTNGLSLVYAVKFEADTETETVTQQGNVICNLRAVDGDVATVVCQNHLGMPQHHPKPGQTQTGPFGPRFWTEVSFPTPRQIRLDSAGNFLEGSGQDHQLPQALGNVEDLIFEPLPPHDATDWTAENDCLVTLTQFVRLSPISGFGRLEETSLAAHEKNTYHATPADQGMVAIRKSYELKTREQSNNQPRLQLIGEGTITFDPSIGQPRTLDFKGMVTETSTNTTRRVPVTLSYRLLTGAERTNALTPPAPVKVEPKPLTAAQLQLALLDLKSADSGRRQMAASTLADAKPTDPTNDVVKALIPALSDSNWAVRQTVARALGVWATPDAYPPLIRTLDDPEFSVRWAAIDALAHTRYEPAAAAFAKHLAAGTDTMKNGDALRALGAPAEPAVLDLLKEKDSQTRYEACRILKDIGTQAALPALTTAATDSDGITAMLAREAITAIDARK